MTERQSQSGGTAMQSSIVSEAQATPLHTAPANIVCLLCSREIGNDEVYLPVYVEAWIVGNVHERCYATRVESWRMGPEAEMGIRR